LNLQLAFLIWSATVIGLAAAPIDQKTSQGPFSLGQAISSLDKSKLTKTGGKESETKDGKKIPTEYYKFDTTGSNLLYGDIPVSSVHLDVVEGSVVTIYLLLDSDLLFGPRDKYDKSLEKRRTLSQALIAKYGPPKEVSDKPSEQTAFIWQGDDVTFAFYFTCPGFLGRLNDDGACVAFMSKRVTEKANNTYLEALKSKAEQENEDAQKLKDKL
jgi:hypothetical protein